MSTNFQAIPVRLNSTPITSAWFNAIRAAGMAFEAAYTTLVTGIIGGGGSTSEASVALTGGQTNTNLTGVLASNTYRKYEIPYWARLTNGTLNYMEVGMVVAWWNGTVWQWAYAYRDGDTFLDLAVDDATGQFKYSTAAMGGTIDTTNSKFGFNLRTQG